MSPPNQRVAYLHITKTNGTYSFTLQDQSNIPLAYEVFLSAPKTVRARIQSDYSQLLLANASRMRSMSAGPARTVKKAQHSGNSPLTAQELSESLTQFLFPYEMAELLRSVRPSALILTTNDPSIPWELANIEGRMLSDLVAVGKSVKTSQPFRLNRPLQPKPRIRILLISNPTEDLPGAEEEFRALMAISDHEIHLDTTPLVGSEASLDNIATLLRSEQFDVLHFAGHTHADLEGKAVFHLADTLVSASYLANISHKNCPRLLFLNSCTSAVVTSSGIRHNYLDGIAPHFLHSGAAAVIGSLWPILDLDSVAIAKSFYTSLARGFAIGKCLQTAKQVSRSSDPGRATWLGYTLVGDPLARLVDDSAWKDLRSRSDGFQAARDLFARTGGLTVGGIHPLLLAADTYDAKLISIAALCQRSQAIVIPPGSDTHPHSLRSSRIGVCPNTGMHAYLSMFLRRHNLEETELQVVFLDQDELCSALEEGALDAAVLWEPWLSAFLARDYESLPSAKAEDDFTLCCLAARSRDLLESQEVIATGLRRYLYVLQLINEKRLELSQITAISFDISPEIAARGLKAFDFSVMTQASVGAVLASHRAYIEKQVDLLCDLDLLSKSFNLESACALPQPFLDAFHGSSLDAASEPTPVSVQVSISSGPLLAGRFLGLFK